MANVKVAYASSAAYTITLASLATSSTLVAGAESDSVDNTSNLYLDYLIGGKITTGSSPSAGTIEVWAYGSVDDTPTYPDVFDGTGSAETVTAASMKANMLAWLTFIPTDTTSNRTFWFGPVSLAGAFARLTGGMLWVPKKHGIFVVHNTGVNLNSTGSNHAISYTPVYMTVT